MSAATSRQELRGNSATVARILTEAETLFGRRTYSDVTVAEICGQAGIATGSFYKWFESKEELFVTLVRSINRDVRAAMREAIEGLGGHAEIREAAFGAFFDLMSERPHVYRIVREAEFVCPGVFREYYERLSRSYARGVRMAQIRGEIDADYDPEVIAYAYMGVGYFIGMRWAEWTQGGLVPNDVRREALRLFNRALPSPEVDSE